MKNILFMFPYLIVRYLRRQRYKMKRINLLLRGVVVDKTALVHPAAILEPSGGEIVIGARTFIDRGVIIRALAGNVEIGDDCSVNAYSVLLGGGKIQIGHGTRIAAHSMIVAANHEFSDPNKPIWQQGLTKKGILIEGDVWIGGGVKILDGVRIGIGSVIGAGSVVTKSVEPGIIVVGVPAKQIASR